MYLNIFLSQFILYYIVRYELYFLQYNVFKITFYSHITQFVIIFTYPFSLWFFYNTFQKYHAIIINKNIDHNLFSKRFKYLGNVVIIYTVLHINLHKKQHNYIYVIYIIYYD